MENIGTIITIVTVVLGMIVALYKLIKKIDLSINNQIPPEEFRNLKEEVNLNSANQVPLEDFRMIKERQENLSVEIKRHSEYLSKDRGKIEQAEKDIIALTGQIINVTETTRGFGEKLNKIDDKIDRLLEKFIEFK